MQRLTLLFPLLALAFSVVAFLAPDFFIPFKPAIVPLLGIIMFAMGMTLTTHDFRRVLVRPRIIAVGTALQYTVMPLAAFSVARVLGLSPELSAGMILVGSSAGGTASNVICYLARGDVALSITLTMVSTALAVVATPVLTWLYIGQVVPVPVGQMFLSVLKIVLVPVVLGAIVNTAIGPRLRGIKPILPWVSMAAIVFIIAIIVALNQPRLADMGTVVIAAVAIHNLVGLAAGYWMAGWLGYDNTIRRTLAIEVGMQNSGLSVALAVKYFSPAAALPGAAFSIWHNLTGSGLASLWGRQGDSTGS